MAQLRQDYSEFIKLETRVIVVGPEGANAFQAYWEQHDLPFIGLPDPYIQCSQALWAGSEPVQAGSHARPGDRG